MFKLKIYLKDFKKELIIGPLAKLTEAIFELIVPLLMAQIIDVGAKNNDLPYVLKMGGLMLLLGALGLCCAITCQYLAARASQGFGTVLRNKLFSHINTLSVLELEKIGASSLVTRMTNDTNQLQLAVAMLIRLVIRVPFLVIGAATISVFIDLKLSLIFFCAIPFIVLALFLVMKFSVPLYKTVQQKLDNIAMLTRENLKGVRVIRAFCGQKKEVKRFNQTNDELKNSAVRVGKLSALLSPITYILMNIAIIAIIWFGGYRVFDGALMQGQIIALVQYMTQILLALTVLADLVIIFTKASASAKRINEVFETLPTVTELSKTPVTLDENAPAVSFKNVSFSYGGDGEMAVSNLSFSIKSGQTIGIIGGTGSGKSTLVKLMARLYDAVKGNILIFGNDIKAYPFEQLHSILSMVPQKATLFEGTIRSNLSLSKSVSEETLKSAVTCAQADDFIKNLPLLFDSPVTQGGNNFSGGQKQRLTIARALVANPKILILDDSTSALDYQTDANLRKALAENSKDKTVIMVSQRVQSIKSCDIIFVLDDGKIINAQTHENLIKTCEVYSEICVSQGVLTQKGEIV